MDVRNHFLFVTENPSSVELGGVQSWLPTYDGMILQVGSVK